MSVELLRKRYLRIVKDSLSFLKGEGFQKKGQKYFCERDNLIFLVYPDVDHVAPNWYRFTIDWEVRSYDPDLVHVYTYNIKKEQTDGYLMSGCLQLKGLAHSYLTDEDPEDFDARYIEEVQKEIRTFVLPLFASLHSFDDVIALAEKEWAMIREDRIIYRHVNLSSWLALYYAAKGWKDKMLSACDRSIVETPATARELAEKDKSHYIKYFEKYKQK